MHPERDSCCPTPGEVRQVAPAGLQSSRVGQAESQDHHQCGEQYQFPPGPNGAQLLSQHVGCRETKQKEGDQRQALIIKHSNQLVHGNQKEHKHEKHADA